MKLTNATAAARHANVTNQMGRPVEGLRDKLELNKTLPAMPQDSLTLGSRPGRPGQAGDVKPGGPFHLGQKPGFDGIKPGGPHPIDSSLLDNLKPGNLDGMKPAPGIQKPAFPGVCAPAGLGEPKQWGHGAVDFSDMKPTQQGRPGAEADAGRKTFSNPIGDAANWLQQVLR